MCRRIFSFDADKIDAFLAAEHGATDPSDLNYLVLHLRELPEDGKKYIIWASFFGATFKANEVALMMDWEDTGTSAVAEEEADTTPWRLSKAINSIRENSLSTSRGSMRGLQIAIAEGWLVQRARDMCSFTHDKYLQAAAAEAQKLPEETIATMSFRVNILLSVPFASAHKFLVRSFSCYYMTTPQIPIELPNTLKSAFSYDKIFTVIFDTTSDA